MKVKDRRKKRRERQTGEEIGQETISVLSIWETAGRRKAQIIYKEERTSRRPRGTAEEVRKKKNLGHPDE